MQRVPHEEQREGRRHGWGGHRPEEEGSEAGDGGGGRGDCLGIQAETPEEHSLGVLGLRSVVRSGAGTYVADPRKIGGLVVPTTRHFYFLLA